MPFQSISEGIPGPPGPAGPGTFTEETSIISVRDYGAKGDGVTGDRNAIYNAIAAANNRELLFPAGTYRVESDLTFGPTVAVRFLNGAKLSIDSGVTVTINGPLEAELYQIFSGDGSVVIGKGAVPMVYPQWWGAVGDGSNDDTSAIQAAMDAIGSSGIIYLPGGIYKTTSTLVIDKLDSNYRNPSHGIILEGEGIAKTKLNYTAGSGYALSLTAEAATGSQIVCHHIVRGMRIEAPNANGGAIKMIAACYNVFEDLMIRNVPNGNAVYLDKNTYGSMCIFNRFNKVFIYDCHYAFYMDNGAQIILNQCDMRYNGNCIYHASGGTTGMVWATDTELHTVEVTGFAVNMMGGRSTWSNIFMDRGMVYLNGGVHHFRSGYVGEIEWTDGTVVSLGKELYNNYANTTDVAFMPDQFCPMTIITANDPRNITSGEEAYDDQASNGKCVQLDTKGESVVLNFYAGYYFKRLTRGKYLITIRTKDTSSVNDDFRIYHEVDSEARNAVNFTLTSKYQLYHYMITIGPNDAGSDVKLWTYKYTAQANTISVDYFQIQYVGPDIQSNEIVIHNPEHSNANGARASRIWFWGERSDGKVSALASIRASHDGTADDEKGKIEIKVNDGADGYSPKTRISIDSAGKVDIIGRLCTSVIVTFFSGDTTPSVSAGNVFKTANAVSTTITTFENGAPGQIITVIIGDNNTLIDFTGTNLKGNSGTDWTPISGDHMTCVFDGNNWYCTVSNNTS